MAYFALHLQASRLAEHEQDLLAGSLVKSELIKLIEPTRKEQGCIQYELHQDNDRPEVFLFYESRETHALWHAHMENDHLKAYLEATDGAVTGFTLNEMSSVE